jgi:hypothetical protein
MPKATNHTGKLLSDLIPKVETGRSLPEENVVRAEGVEPS